MTNSATKDAPQEKRGCRYCGGREVHLVICRLDDKDADYASPVLDSERAIHPPTANETHEFVQGRKGDERCYFGYAPPDIHHGCGQPHDAAIHRASGTDAEAQDCPSCHHNRYRQRDGQCKALVRSDGSPIHDCGCTDLFHSDTVKFTGATCRGSYALGTACGECERCKLERPQPASDTPPVPQREAPDEETDEEYEVRIVNPPKRIWLQTGCDDEVGEIDFSELAEVTWCQERIDKTDIEYILRTTHDAEVARLRQEAFEEAAQVAENNGGGHYMARSCASAIRKYAAALNSAGKE